MWPLIRHELSRLRGLALVGLLAGLAQVPARYPGWEGGPAVAGAALVLGLLAVVAGVTGTWAVDRRDPAATALLTLPVSRGVLWRGRLAAGLILLGWTALCSLPYWWWVPAASRVTAEPLDLFLPVLTYFGCAAWAAALLPGFSAVALGGLFYALAWLSALVVGHWGLGLGGEIPSPWVAALALPALLAGSRAGFRAEKESQAAARACGLGLAATALAVPLAIWVLTGGRGMRVADVSIAGLTQPALSPLPRMVALELRRGPLPGGRLYLATEHVMLSLYDGDVRHVGKHERITHLGDEVWPPTPGAISIMSIGRAHWQAVCATPAGARARPVGEATWESLPHPPWVHPDGGWLLRAAGSSVTFAPSGRLGRFGPDRFVWPGGFEHGARYDLSRLTWGQASEPSGRTLLHGCVPMEPLPGR